MLRRLGAGVTAADDHGAPCEGWVITTPPVGVAPAPTATARGVGAPSWMSTPDAVPLLWKDDVWRRLPSSVPDCEFMPPPPPPAREYKRADTKVSVCVCVRTFGARLVIGCCSASICFVYLAIISICSDGVITGQRLQYRYLGGRAEPGFNVLARG